jgi:hypothetical protein
LLKDKLIFRGAGFGIILGIACRISVDTENLLIVEVDHAMLAYWPKRKALLIGCL